VADDSTLVWRAPAGIAVLLALALRDRMRNGTWARVHELAFLFGATLIVIAYAIAHDAVTWSISRDYFVIGKAMPEAERGIHARTPSRRERIWAPTRVARSA
jgi:hypothetical protein